MRNKKFGLTMLGLCLCCSLLAGNGKADAENPGEGTAKRTVTDSTGRAVTIPAKVERVIVIKGACMVPGILSALNCGDRLVSGLCFNRGEKDIQIRVEPHYAELDVLTPQNGAVNVEALATLDPDIVFVWSNVKNRDELESAGIPVVATELSSWDSVEEMFEQIGAIMGREKESDDILTYMKETAGEVEQLTAAVPPGQRKRALFISRTEPLTAMGNKSHNHFMIETAGGVSAASGLEGHFASLSLETLYELDPDVIFLSAVSPLSRREILQSPEWRQLKAVRTEQVYTCPSGVFFWDKPGAEIPLFLLWLDGMAFTRKSCHPE